VWLEAAIKYECRSVQGVAEERMGKLTSWIRKVKILLNISAVWLLLFSFPSFHPHEI